MAADPERAAEHADQLSDLYGHLAATHPRAAQRALTQLRALGGVDSDLADIA